MVHLQTKSCYSLLDSPFRPAQIIEKAKENGFQAVGLSDVNTMLAVPEFIERAQKAGIKPILGLEISLEVEEESLPLLLLAKDIEGLRSLYAISSLISAKAKVITIEVLKEVLQNCFVLALNYQGLLKDLSQRKNGDRAEQILSLLSSSFSDFYLGICALDQGIKVQEESKWLCYMAQPLEIPAAAISYIEYARPDDFETARLLEAIKEQKLFKDRSLTASQGRYFRSQREMEFLYEKELLDNTDRIAAQISYDFSLQKNHLPVFENPSALDNQSYLKALAFTGLKKRKNPIPRIYLERLKQELDLIISMDFADYFLIVWDLIREARKRKIQVGPGRGSAAGSLVSYCLGISHVDPIENGLLFERFLNPERISMPDIDIDFPDDRRDEMIVYLQEKYGADHVSHIITYQRMKAKAALRDAARALQISTYEVERLTRLIKPNQSLRQTYQSNAHFRLLVQGEAHFTSLFEKALKLEGLPRHLSLHAAGIVLSKEPIERVAPLIQAGSEIYAEQFGMHYLENLGLIKFDLLSLKNLSMLENIRKEVSELEGKEIDLLSLPLDQNEVYAMLSKGLGMGIFQLESKGIRKLLQDYKAQNFADIAAILALYRPGPMRNIHLYLSARHRSNAPSPHPLLDDLLKESHGVFLYQEQIMKAVQILAGFSLAQADSLRKAMSKKDRALMDSYRSSFIEGCKHRQIEEKKAREIFSLIERFSEYGFNKSHSYAYALIVYQMAYLKALYPAVFFKHGMNESLSNTRKLVDYQNELPDFDLKLLPFSLSKSETGFVIEEKGLRLPLTLIKGLSFKTVRKIVEEREKKPFSDLNDALLRLFWLDLETEEIEALICLGALDEFERNRESILEALERYRQFASIVQMEKESLYDSMHLTPPEFKEVKIDENKRLFWQQKYLGFYPLGHPVQNLRKQGPNISQLLSIKGNLEVIALVSEVKQVRTKKGADMSFISLEDESGSIEMALMPDKHHLYFEKLKAGMIIKAGGRKSREKSFVADWVQIVKN